MVEESTSDLTPGQETQLAAVLDRRLHPEARSRHGKQKRHRNGSKKAAKRTSRDIQPLVGLPVPISSRVAGSSPMPVDGVNVSGFFRHESGVGAAARGYMRALEHLGIPMGLHDLSHIS
jgi:hypothetical protein